MPAGQSLERATTTMLLSPGRARIDPSAAPAEHAGAQALLGDAYLARLRLRDIPAFVTAHGDDTAGAVLVKLNTLDGQARAFQRSFDLMSGERRWVVLAEGAEQELHAAY